MASRYSALAIKMHNCWRQHANFKPKYLKNKTLVLRVGGLLLNFDELTIFWIILFPSHTLFYIQSDLKLRYRASHAIPSNRPTEVSLH